MKQLDWNTLIFGTYSPQQVAWAVACDEWQQVRLSMLGQPLEVKYDTLMMWLDLKGYCERAKIQVTNYVNALKRGGLIRGGS